MSVDLSRLSVSELDLLAQDLREQIIEVTQKNGGHLGASLGAVEIAVALHRVFHSPEDALIWDVGHQAYAHKLLTGRQDRFSTLRQKDGLSGFLSRSESPHDIFGAGHSGTALSAALGYSWRNRENWTVAVVGDGGFTAGLTLEALNNLSSGARGPLLVVLNDNQMSISPNVGAVSAILAGSGAASFFAAWGIEYVGPGDGHDLGYLVKTLTAIRNTEADRPLLLHLRTQKGRGYAPATSQPSRLHGVAPRAPLNPGIKAISWSDRFSRRVLEHARKDPSIVAVTAAMAEGTGLQVVADERPSQFVDVGIAEPHAITFAAGLAAAGKKPVVAIYSTFLQRALDGLIHDVALQKLPVIIGVDRAGLVGQDGATHQGAFDLCYLSMIPGFTVFSPATLKQLDECVDRAFEAAGPVAIRYGRGTGPECLAEGEQIELCQVQQCSRPGVIVIALGPTVNKAREALALLGARASAVALWSTAQAKPIAPELVRALEVHSGCSVVTLEEGVVPGGFGSRVRALAGVRPFEEWGLPDTFIEHGTPGEQEQEVGLNAQRLAERLGALLG